MDDDDYLGREAARREQAREWQAALHPHPNDPDHLDDEPCSCCGCLECNGQCYGDDMMGGD